MLHISVVESVKWLQVLCAAVEGLAISLAERRGGSGGGYTCLSGTYAQDGRVRMAC